MSIETAKDRELLDAAMQGSYLAYRELIHLHQAAVYRFAWAMLGNEDAQRVTENAFLTAWRQLDYLKQLNLTFRARLFQLVCLDCAELSKRQLRHRINLPTSQSEDVLNFPFAPRRYDPRTNMEHLALQSDIEDALRALPLPMRQALLLHKMGGFADTQIADITGGEAAKIHADLVRSRALLRRQILLSGGFFPLSEETDGSAASQLRACGAYLPTLDAAADNLCTAEEKQTLSAHMAECPGCQNYYDALCAINHGIAVMKQEVPGDMAQYILQRIQEETEQNGCSNSSERRCRRPRFAFGRFTIIGLCIALVLLAYSGGILNSKDQDDPSSVPGQTQQTPPKAPENSGQITPPAPDPPSAPPEQIGAGEAVHPDSEPDDHPDPEAARDLVPDGETYAAVYLAESSAKDLLAQACTLSFPAALSSGESAMYYVVPTEAQETLSTDLDEAAASCIPYTDEADAIDSAAQHILYIILLS